MCSLVGLFFVLVSYFIVVVLRRVFRDRFGRGLPESIVSAGLG